MTNKWDITIIDVDSGGATREFIIGEQTRNQVIQALEYGIEQGDGHEVLL